MWRMCYSRSCLSRPLGRFRPRSIRPISIHFTWPTGCRAGEKWPARSNSPRKRSAHMADRILCVDDDPNILEGYKRQLRKEFELVTAVGPEQGLQMGIQQGPFAVVVSDLQMPGMNGVEFLAQVRTQEPDTVRMLLTGNAELQSAIEAINQGQIFRFLTKPCAGAGLGG